MLCPCCGDEIVLESRECGCGARFVGSPLDHKPVKVQQFGPLMIAGLLFLTVVGTSLVLTKWLAFASIIALWHAWRAMRLARNNPQEYGGYRTATALLVVAATSAAAASGFGIAYIPRYLDNRLTRQFAANEAIIRHQQGLVEGYKLLNGSYPEDQKFFGATMPKDFWGNPLTYESVGETAGITSTETIARTSSQPSPRVGDLPRPRNRSVSAISPTNFTLRSAGPDGKMGTEDDIVMRDGVFVANTEVKK